MDTISISVEGEALKIKEEASMCLGLPDVKLTLGGAMLLYLEDSPFVGGKDRKNYLDRAMDIVLGNGKHINADSFADKLLHAIDACTRAWGTVRRMPSLADRPDNPAEHSDSPIFSPEWMADTMALACSAMPSLTYDQCLWRIPLIMLIHLGNAAYRRQGGVTRRDHGEREAIKELLRLRAQEAANGQD